MDETDVNTNEPFWQPQVEAWEWLGGVLSEFLDRCRPARRLAERLLAETGTRLVDWVDAIALRSGQGHEQRLEAVGFQSTEVDGQLHWRHPGGLFPLVRVIDGPADQLIVKVESVTGFLFAHRIDSRTAIYGLSGWPLRLARVAAEEAAELWVVERHGQSGFEPHEPAAGQVEAALAWSEQLLRRQRHFDCEADGFDHTLQLVRQAQRDLGTDWTCDLFFAAERRWWQSRNRAAQVQKQRQDALGMGWANHDHHTYRSSREHFARLIALLEQLGLECRERFYGGQEAGWGAQVLEHPRAGIVVFADVDLTPEEVSGDFAHEGLQPAERLGTVGLWCRLHGEAMLQAGLHHLECRFDFDAARRQLAKAGVRTMPPFTDLPYLKQAFTEGELWPVEAQRLEGLVSAGQLTRVEAERLARSGALGSHLEILQRDQGYKGFNQTGISQIIRQTDPRRCG